MKTPPAPPHLKVITQCAIRAAHGQLAALCYLFQWYVCHVSESLLSFHRASQNVKTAITQNMLNMRQKYLKVQCCCFLL